MKFILAIIFFGGIFFVAWYGGRFLSNLIHGEQPPDKYPYPNVRGYGALVYIILMLIALFVINLFD
jgi:hypothetical protein